MMIHAYQEIYLSKAQSVLGEAFEYGVNTCEILGEDFIKLFLVSTISHRIENGESAIISGKSGIEIVREIIFETTRREITNEPKDYFGRTKEYWIGWAVAYYQWYSSRKYSEIFTVLSFEELEQMYYTLHEADISKFSDIVDIRIREYFKDTNLRRIRLLYGCTQEELAQKSGVDLHVIQMCEQRSKDINKVSVETIYRISKILGCTIEDLIEK